MNLYVIDQKFVKTISLIDDTGVKKFVAGGSGAFTDAKTKFEADWNLVNSSAVSRLDSRDFKGHEIQFSYKKDTVEAVVQLDEIIGLDLDKLTKLNFDVDILGGAPDYKD